MPKRLRRSPRSSEAFQTSGSDSPGNCFPEEFTFAMTMLFDGNVVFTQLLVRHDGLEERAAADYPVLPSLDWCLVLQLCERHETGALRLKWPYSQTKHCLVAVRH